MESKSAQKIIMVKVQDVEYTGEDITMGENNPDNNNIYLLLKEVQTGDLFVSVLSHDDVRELTGFSLSPKEMMFFADKLRERKQPMRVVVNPESEQITPEMLSMSEEDLLLLQQDEQRLNENARDIINKFRFKGAIDA